MLEHASTHSSLLQCSRGNVHSFKIRKMRSALFRHVAFVGRRWTATLGVTIFPRTSNRSVHSIASPLAIDQLHCSRQRPLNAALSPDIKALLVDAAGTLIKPREPVAQVNNGRCRYCTVFDYSYSSQARSKWSAKPDYYRTIVN